MTPCDIGFEAMSDVVQDQKWMTRALELAREAGHRGEIPVGAVMTHEGEIIAEASNRKEEWNQPLAHAETLVIEEAARKLGRWRLSGCTLYVTLEPCVMCSGAIVHARLDRVVYATPDPKTGAVQSIYRVLSDSRLNHAPQIHQGVLQAEASELLKNFFKALRSKTTEIL